MPEPESKKLYHDGQGMVYIGTRPIAALSPSLSEEEANELANTIVLSYNMHMDLYKTMVYLFHLAIKAGAVIPAEEYDRIQGIINKDKGE